MEIDVIENAEIPDKTEFTDMVEHHEHTCSENHNDGYTVELAYNESVYNGYWV